MQNIVWTVDGAILALPLVTLVALVALAMPSLRISAGLTRAAQ